MKTATVTSVADSVIKLTDLAGRPFWIKPGTVTLVREPYVNEFGVEQKDVCKAVIFQGPIMHGVRETVAQVMGALGQV